MRKNHHYWVTFLLCHNICEMKLVIFFGLNTHKLCNFADINPKHESLHPRNMYLSVVFGTWTAQPFGHELIIRIGKHCLTRAAH